MRRGLPKLDSVGAAWPDFGNGQYYCLRCPDVVDLTDLPPADHAVALGGHTTVWHPAWVATSGRRA